MQQLADGLMGTQKIQLTLAAPKAISSFVISSKLSGFLTSLKL